MVKRCILALVCAFTIFILPSCGSCCDKNDKSCCDISKPTEQSQPATSTDTNNILDTTVEEEKVAKF